MTKIISYTDDEYYWVATILKSKFTLDEVGIRDVNFYGDNDKHPDRKFLERASYFCESNHPRNPYPYAPTKVRTYILDNIHELTSQKESYVKIIENFLYKRILEMAGVGIPISTIQMSEPIKNIFNFSHWRGIKLETISNYEYGKSEKINEVCLHRKLCKINCISEEKYGRIIRDDVELISVSPYLNYILPETTNKLFEDLKIYNDK